MRVGQKNKLTYRWARTGSRPPAVHDQRTQSTYLFGAVCPEQGKGSGLVLPVCNAEAMQLHLDDIAAKVAPRAHAILIFDQAGWHGAKSLRTPTNVSLMPLPAALAGLLWTALGPSATFLTGASLSAAAMIGLLARARAAGPAQDDAYERRDA